MQFDVTNRRSGKTARMLDWAEAGGEDERRVIVCHSESAARQLRIRIKHEKREIDSSQVISVTGLSRFHGSRPRVKLGIEELQLVLDNIMGYEVVRVSATEC